jgi:hypothetical protein
MHLPIGFCARFSKCSEEQVRVLAVAEHRFGVVATVHDVVNTTRVLDLRAIDNALAGVRGRYKRVRQTFRMANDLK